MAVKNKKGPGKSKTKKKTTPKKALSQKQKIQARYPKHTVRQIRNSNKFSLTDKRGHSVTLSPGKKVKNPGKTVKQAIKIKNKK